MRCHAWTMSSVYITEPPTKGKVVLHTSYGDVDIELWPKEAPKAVRNFVQLCLEGYYDNIIFHRIIKELFIQTGDPTGTGRGGDSIYEGFFPDEVHSRLRFSHRGQVACANMNLPNTNGSQFFITLEKAPWLDKKHTIFGKVTGNTIFNVLRMGDVEVDKDDRPLEPPRLISVEVMDNPFPDIVARNVKASAEQEKKLAAQSRVRQEKLKKPASHLLSFGDDDDDEEDRPAPRKKIVSAHEVLAGKDSMLSAAAPEPEITHRIPPDSAQHTLPAASSKRPRSPDPAPVTEDSKRPRFGATVEEPPIAKADTLGAAHASDMRQTLAKPDDRNFSEFDKLRDKYLASKRAVGVLTGQHRESADAAVAAEKLSTPLMEIRSKYLSRKERTKGREQDTLTRLSQFTKSLREKVDTSTGDAPAESYSGQVLEDRAEDGDDKDDSWMASKLKFKKHIDDQFRYQRSEDDGLVTIDPMRLPKDKR